MIDYCRKSAQHVFIIGSKSIGQYGGYETFVDHLIAEHQNVTNIQYHIACKANGDGCLDETKLSGTETIKMEDDGRVTELVYKNAHIVKISCPKIGSAVAICYDREAMEYSIRYCRIHSIPHPVFYVLTCRIGLYINRFRSQIADLGGEIYLNPDGHEWMRAKWPYLVRKYWKWSERRMVKCSDQVICDSKIIQKYIRDEYRQDQPKTKYIAYGADVTDIETDDTEFLKWLKINNLDRNQYYLVVGRFVPENNYETMIREFMTSQTARDLVIVTNMNESLKRKLEEKLGFSADPRIKFVGTVYEKDLLKKIRENAYGYIHGHEVGGTNPSLLEALGSTKLNLLLDVGFNHEVGKDAAVYWNKKKKSLSGLIARADRMSDAEREAFGEKAKERIRTAYSWAFIGEEYKKLWLNRKEEEIIEPV